MNEEFTVYRDGEPDKEFARTKQIEALQSNFKALGRYVLGSIGNAASRALDELDVAIYDHKHQTNLHSQYVQKRKAERTLAFAAMYDLA